MAMHTHTYPHLDIYNLRHTTTSMGTDTCVNVIELLSCESLTNSTASKWKYSCHRWLYAYNCIYSANSMAVLDTQRRS